MEAELRLLTIEFFIVAFDFMLDFTWLSRLPIFYLLERFMVTLNLVLLANPK